MIIGYQAVFDKDFYQAIDYASNNIYDYISFDLNVPRFQIDRFDRQTLGNIREYSQQKNIGIAFHAPGDNISLFSDYPSIRSGIIEYYKQMISAAELLNTRHITIHAGIYPSFKKAAASDDDFLIEHSSYFHQVLYENLAEICSFSKDILICIENFEFSDFTRGILDSAFGKIPLFLTWDIAKTYDRQMNLNQEVEEFMYKHIERIREVHLHDLKKDFHGHQTVGTGDIDFKRYFHLFERPELAITIEVRPREEATISRDKLVEMMSDR